jgi:hypothetical protein
MGKRFETPFDVDAATLEYWQATNYFHNDKFDYHLDAGCWGFITQASGFLHSFSKYAGEAWGDTFQGNDLTSASART